MKAILTSLMLIAECTSNAQSTYIFTKTENVAIPDNAYDGTASSMAFQSVEVSGIPAGKNFIDMQADVKLAHTFTGDLTVKLKTPADQFIALMSRPGYSETADDGNGCCGSGADINGTVSFWDFSDTTSENIADLGSPVPDFALVQPSYGAIAVPPHIPFLADGSNELGDSSNFNGIWELFAGDSAAGDIGELQETKVIFLLDDYCVPRLNNGFEHITNVTFGDINNSSGATPGQNYPAYYSIDMGTTVTQGETYPFSVTISAESNEYVYVFIDWNQDKDFDDENEVYTVASDTDLDCPHTLDMMQL